ncbi:MAG: O-methyltransferase [Planctomycetota bacterium]|nr:MAG: O-methyltransferase [Planctomycetota bacterium]
MSTVPTQVTAELFNYLIARTTPEDAFLKELREAAIAAALPAIWISPEQAVFMHILLQISGAKRVLEIGTLGGYSAVAMAQALGPDGHIDTLELEPRHVAFAREWIERGGFTTNIHVHQGAALDTLASLAAGPTYDAVFIDADKGNYAAYLHQTLDMVRPGGLIMVDNAFAFGRILEDQTTTDDVWAIRAFNDLMAREQRVMSLIVPIADGLWVGVKQG